MEDIELADIQQEQGRDDIPGDAPEPGRVPTPLIPEERLELLTVDETIDVSTMGRRITSIFRFLNGTTCTDMTAAQKNAFYFLAMSFGLERSMIYHPDMGADPLNFVNMDSVRNDSLPFREDDPLTDVPLAGPMPVFDRSTRGVSFNPPASSTRIDTSASPTTGSADLTAVLQRLAVLEANKGLDTVVGQEELYQLVPCPRLGTKSNTAIAVKNLKVLYGNDKFSNDDPLGPPIRGLLLLVADSIEKNGLNSASSFLCLITMLKGDLHSLVSSFSVEGMPFAKAWEFLQINAASAYSRDQCEKDIAKHMKTKP